MITMNQPNWRHSIGGIILEASNWRHEDHTQTQNDVVLKSCILKVQHYRKMKKTIVRDASMLEHLRDLCDNMIRYVIGKLDS